MKFIMEELMPEQCPPANAIPKAFNPVYRFCKNSDSLCSDDFKNQITLESKRAKTAKKKGYPDPEELCGLIAVSFFDDIEVMKTIQENSYFFKKRQIVQGKIQETDGVAEKDGPHVNLWVYNGKQLEYTFSDHT